MEPNDPSNFLNGRASYTRRVAQVFFEAKLMPHDGPTLPPLKLWATPRKGGSCFLFIHSYAREPNHTHLGNVVTHADFGDDAPRRTLMLFVASTQS